MAKKVKSLDEILQGKEEMVFQTYDDTTLKLFTRGRHMREGETRTFDVTMVEDFEKFVGHEVVHERWTRNPMVWEGTYINVHRDKQGHYQVHLKRLEMTERMHATRVGSAIITELLTAKRALGL